MKPTLLFCVILFGFCGENMFAQTKIETRKKGNFDFYWGYNRAIFSNSDIRFTGKDYDFELQDIVAKDRPTDFTFKDYFGIANLTIPQYNLRLGYYIAKNLSIGIGTDHMKYVMVNNQPSTINGEIHETNNPFNGSYHNENILVTDSFLGFEHTDGLNYVNLSAEYYLDVLQTQSGKVNIAAFGGGGLGMMFPKSNVRLMSGPRNDEFHVAGYGLHAAVGLRFLFFKHLFLRTQLKGGFLHMPDILTRPNGAVDRASQHFMYTMFDFAVGYQWHF